MVCRTSCSSGNGSPNPMAPTLSSTSNGKSSTRSSGLAEMPGCRRQALLAYFGELNSPPCGNCDNCLTPPRTEDGTVIAQKALSAVYRTGQRFGVTYLADILAGKADERVLRNGHDRLSVFGIGKDVPQTTWKGLFRQLTAAGYLTGR